MKLFIKIFFSVLVIDVALALLFMRNKMEADSWLEFGFPFIFYKRTAAKLEPGMAHEYFYWSPLLWNLLIILAVPCLVLVIIGGLKKK